MLPFVVDAFQIVACNNRPTPPTPDKLYYGQRVRGGPIADERNFKTFEWVYYNKQITRTFNDWGAYDKPYLAARFPGPITFQTWVEAINPETAPAPKLYTLRIPCPDPIDIRAVEREIMQKLISKVQTRTGLKKPLFQTALDAPIARFQAEAIQFISKNLSNDEPLQRKCAIFVTELTREYPYELAKRREEKEKADELIAQHKIMNERNALLLSRYKERKKMEAAITVTITTYFRELLDTPIRYHYT
jgi:hypothetical protein